MKLSIWVLFSILIFISACAPATRMEETSKQAPAIFVDTATKYLEYSDEGFAEAQAAGKIIYLEFSAGWCPECRRLDPLIRESIRNLNNPEVVAFQVDYDNSADLQRKYGVIYQHTHIILKKDGAVSWKSLDAKWSDELFISEISKAGDD